MLYSPLILSFSILPLILAAPTATTTCAPACPTDETLPSDVSPYFFVKTNTFNDPSSLKNNLYLSGYHVEAALSVAVLVDADSAFLAYLNGSYLQLASELGPTPEDSIYWYLLLGDDVDEVATPQMVSVFGGEGVGEGYYVNDTDGSGRTGLKYGGPGFDTNLFVGWLACDWFGTAGDVQLFPQFSRYWEGGDVQGLGPDGVLPANCEAIELVQEFACN